MEALRFALLTLVFAAACGGPHRYAVVGSDGSERDGTVTIERIEGGQSLVTVALDELSPPDRMGDGLSSYVVWFIGRDRAGRAQVVRGGELDYDAERRQGLMHATTPLQAFELKITAERGPSVTSPSDAVVGTLRVPTRDT